MDIVEAFKTEGAYDEYFAKLRSLDEEQDALYKEMVANIEQKFGKLLEDDNGDNQQGEFLVPELPKFRKEGKGKRVSRVTTKRSVASNVSGIQPLQTCSESLGEFRNDESFRRSSRIASKNLGKQEISALPIRQSRVRGTDLLNDAKAPIPEPGPQISTSTNTLNETYVKEAPVSSNIFVNEEPDPALKSIPVKLDPGQSSVITNIDLEHSGHIKADTSRRSSRVAQKKDAEKVYHTTNNDDVRLKKIHPSRSEPSSPSLPPTKIRCIDLPDSKRISLSKRSLDSTICSTGMKEPISTSTPTNLIVGTPKSNHGMYESPTQTPIRLETAKKQKTKPVIFTEKTVPASSGRCTRNTSKILQEKNTNVKLIEEKCQEAQKKKECMMKSSAEETKRKREERTRKAAALREANEKEKLEIALKQEREKEMKLKHIQKLKDEKLRVETMKKRHIASLKAAELEKKKKEEAAKIAKLKKPAMQECNEYAIDHVSDGASSDEEENPKRKVPSWATKENRKRPLRIQAWLDRKQLIRPWFFYEALKYPKLETLFSENVKTRPRTSSAFWNSQICFD